jgi:hypothetical protein
LIPLNIDDPAEAQEASTQMLQDAGAGSRGIVMGYNCDSHMFDMVNAVHIDGTVRFIDNSSASFSLDGLSDFQFGQTY